ncbi:MAG: tRNA (guanosine(46)-N7)-methyltransferase TrmB [Eubacteriales bacterium]|nr:tRNA (guanosine(46)-N7)-methyltransferase TrmB [Eubacteriales bacterium]
MRLRHIKNAEIIVKEYPLVIQKKVNIVNNTYLELGMGKGQFIIKSSIKYPNIDFIGVEKNASIILKAINNINIEKEKNIPLNIRIINCDIKNLTDYINEKSINIIYLNFSDPWPKKKHINRRLTSPFFLNLYKKILKNDGCIEMKSDNILLFEYSINTLIENNWEIINKSNDLHKDTFLIENNIMTEYEEKFYKKGIKINYLKAIPKSV